MFDDYFDLSMDWDTAISVAEWGVSGGFVGLGTVGGPVGVAVGIAVGGGTGYLLDWYREPDVQPLFAGSVTDGVANEAADVAVTWITENNVSWEEIGVDEETLRDEVKKSIWNYSSYLASESGSAFTESLEKVTDYFRRLGGKLSDYFGELYKRTADTLAVQREEERIAAEQAGTQTPPTQTPQTPNLPTPPTQPQWPGKPKPKPTPYGAWAVGLLVAVLITLAVMKMRKKAK